MATMVVITLRFGGSNVFGKKKKVQFAARTVDDKYELMASVSAEIRDGFWFENGQYQLGRVNLESFIRRIENTDNIVYLTVNSMPPNLRAIAENVAPDLIETLSYPHGSIGLGGNPAYYAHNALLRDMFGVDITDASESDLRAADSTFTMGVMSYAGQRVDSGLNEQTAQSVVVAVTLSAGWAMSPERAQLIA